MIIKGPYPDVEIPETALTPLVLRRAAELADKPALIEGPTGRKLSYKQLADAIGIAAYNLRQRGFKKGEVFGILSPNCPEYAIAFHAVATLGGIVTPINPLYTPYEIAHQLKDSGARFLIPVPSCVEKAAAAAEYRAQCITEILSKQEILHDDIAWLIDDPHVSPHEYRATGIELSKLPFSPDVPSDLLFQRHRTRKGVISALIQI